MNKAEERGKFIKDTTKKTKEYLAEQTGQFLTDTKRAHMQKSHKVMILVLMKH